MKPSKPTSRPRQWMNDTAWTYTAGTLTLSDPAATCLTALYNWSPTEHVAAGWEGGVSAHSEDSDEADHRDARGVEGQGAQAQENHHRVQLIPPGPAPVYRRAAD